jgi:hypothetical protein
MQKEVEKEKGCRQGEADGEYFIPVAHAAG